MDGVQEVCADADVLPCVFDAAVFSYMIRQTSADLALIGRRFPKAARRTYEKTATKACDGNIPSATQRAAWSAYIAGRIGKVACYCSSRHETIACPLRADSPGCTIKPAFPRAAPSRAFATAAGIKGKAARSGFLYQKTVAQPRPLPAD